MEQSDAAFIPRGGHYETAASSPEHERESSQEDAEAASGSTERQQKVGRQEKRDSRKARKRKQNVTEGRQNESHLRKRTDPL
ncbi:hypothetical protein EMIT07CA2_40183 [Brevibacillus sp. IT-7CA2]